MSGNLGLTQVVASQNQKEVTINAALLRLDAAISETFDANLASSNVTVTTAEGQQCTLIRAANVSTSGRTVTVPQVERVFLISNPVASSHSVGFLRGSTTVTLTPGQTAAVRTDGTTNGLVVLMLGSAASSGGTVVKDEGTTVTGGPHTTFNFTGAGVVATNTGGGEVQVAVSGGGSGSTIKDEGTTVAGGPHTALNFTGAAVTVTNSGGGEAQVAISSPGSERALVVPVLANFTQINIGSSVLTGRTYGIGIGAPGLSSPNIAMLARTKPSAPYEFIAKINTLSVPIANNQWGLFFRNSGSGNLQLFVTNTNTPNIDLIIQNWSSPTTFSATLIGPLGISTYPNWLRVTDNGTTREYWWSVNGDDWQSFGTRGSTDYITPDQIGFYWTLHGATSAKASMTLASWQEI